MEAIRHLEACGLGLPQPEGWTFFTGRRTIGRGDSPSRRQAMATLPRNVGN